MIGLEAQVSKHMFTRVWSTCPSLRGTMQRCDKQLNAHVSAYEQVWTSLHYLQALGPELLDTTTVRKIIKVGTDVSAIATDAVTILQYALVRWLPEVFSMCFVCCSGSNVFNFLTARPFPR